MYYFSAPYFMYIFIAIALIFGLYHGFKNKNLKAKKILVFLQLLKLVKEAKMDGWEKGTKQSVVIAMYNLVNVLEFSKMTAEASEICTLFIEIPNYMADAFKQKKNQLINGKNNVMPQATPKKLGEVLLEAKIFQKEEFSGRNFCHICRQFASRMYGSGTSETFYVYRPYIFH